MLAFSLLRYRWLQPQLPDPLQMEHAPLKSRPIPSILDPKSGPQLSRTQLWSKIPHYYAGEDPKIRTLIEIEKDIAEGKDLILVEPEIAAQVFTHYIGFGWAMQENTIFYGGLSLWFSFFHPKLWYIYVPCSVFSLMHSWVYFRVYKYDRISQYQAYGDDNHPVSNLITAWVLGQRPDHYQYVLKKERVLRWEIFSEFTMYSSIILCLVRLWKIEESVVGGPLALSFRQTSSQMAKQLFTPAVQSGYFQPVELVPVAMGSYMPSDIPTIKGIFDLPWFKLKLPPIKVDLAMIICATAGYFVFKACEHFLSPADEEVNELGRERSTLQKGDSGEVEGKAGWISVDYQSGEIVSGERPKPKDPAAVQEDKEIQRIVDTIPYGWVPPGYKENDFGVFT